MEFNIEKMVYGGDGLARLPADASGKGKAAFIPFVLAGERVTSTVVEDRPGFVRARLDSVLQPSAERVSPPCPHFAVCGGCHYQHATYAEQMRIKGEILSENLRRLAKVELTTEIQVHPSPPWQYRNRTRVALRHGEFAKTEGFRLGYRRVASEEILAVEECAIVSPLLQRAITALWKLGRAGQIPASLQEVELFADAEDAKMSISFYQAEESSETKGALDAFASHLTNRVPEMETIALFRERRRYSKTGEAEDTKPKILAGPGSLTYQVSGHAYEVSAGAFFQSNRHLLPDLVRIVTEGRTGATALDLYAGGGLFSLPLAQQFQRVVAVESGNASFRDLRRNLPPQAKAVHSTAEAYLQEAGKKLRPEFVVVDPPRTGLGPKAARRLAECRAPNVAYVSCDPATLARDLAILTEGGYRVECAHLVDLFPQTFHLETVLHLSRK